MAKETQISDIVADLVRQLMTLFRNEGQFARAEISENLEKVGGAVVLLGVGALLLLPAIVILLEAGVAELVQAGWSSASAGLLVGAIVLAIAVVLVLAGLSRIRSVSVVPNKTLRQLRQDFAIVKDMEHEHDVQRAA